MGSIAQENISKVLDKWFMPTYSVTYKDMYS
jgi:hypothetical protein